MCKCLTANILLNKKKKSAYTQNAVCTVMNEETFLHIAYTKRAFYTCFEIH